MSATKPTEAEQAVQNADAERFTEEREDEIKQADIERLASERTTKLINAWDTDVPDDEEGLLRGGIHGLNVSAAALARTGLFFLKLKETHWKRKFVQKLAENDIPKSQVYNAMSVATAMLKLPKTKFPIIGNFNGTQLIELAKLPQETLEEAFETGILNGDKLDDIAKMSVREMQTKWRQERENTTKERAANDRVHQDKNNKIDELAKKVHQLEGGIQDGEPSPCVQEIESEKAQALIPLMRLKNRALLMEDAVEKGREPPREDYFALHAAAEAARSELAQIMDALFNCGGGYQASIAQASMPTDTEG